MARLRYNGLTATLASPGLTNVATAVTFLAPLTHSGGTAVPTISGGDTIPFAILDAAGVVSEIVNLTAYTTGATTGTITRAQESTTAKAHGSGVRLVHAASVADWTTAAGDLTAHLADTVDAHDASAISVVPSGTIAATDVQAALAELDTEKAVTGHAHSNRAGKRFRRTSGDFTISATVATAMASAAGGAAADFDLTVPAAAGDVVLLGIDFATGIEAGTLRPDVYTVVSGGLVNSCAGTPSVYGIPGWTRPGGTYEYVSGFTSYVVQAGDVSSAQVTFRPTGKVDSSIRAIAASSTNPFTFTVLNTGQ